MPERERKQKPAPKERVEETAEVAAPAKQGEELKEELDDLLDEIDSVLETNAEEFVKSLCTKRRRMILRTSVRNCHTPVVRSRGVKRCKKCGETKPLDEFHQATGMRDGHRSECKDCSSHPASLVRRESTDAIANVKRWQQENKEHLHAYRRDYRQRRKVEDRERTFGGPSA